LRADPTLRQQHNRGDFVHAVVNKIDNFADNF
jgi:hypothetical protein